MHLDPGETERISPDLPEALLQRELRPDRIALLLEKLASAEDPATFLAPEAGELHDEVIPDGGDEVEDPGLIEPGLLRAFPLRRNWLHYWAKLGSRSIAFL